MKKTSANRKCLVCGKKTLHMYLDLGKTALANTYLKKRDLQKKEARFPLQVFFCTSCFSVQLGEIVSRKKLFENYAYFSSTSPQLEEYFKKYAQTVYSRFPEQSMRFTLEIASNDGILLKYFQKHGARVLGIDPAKNIARVANKNGIPTLPLFFNEKIAQKIKMKSGTAGIITANNILAHTDIPHSIIKGVKVLLDKKGVFVFEVQYLLDLIQKNEFDNTYHEHVFHFSLHPLTTLLKKWGLEIFDVENVEGQGGSLRIYAGHTPLVFKKKSIVNKILQKEKKVGLHKAKTYTLFGAKPKIIKKELIELIEKLKKQNKKIVGYGASAKGNTLLQYCGLTHNDILYIVDTAPSKQGKFTPGSHIPIVDPSQLKKNVPDYILILAWNFADSIMKKESWFLEQKGSFIVPIPKPKIYAKKK